jgi:hypothetical protein
MVRAHSASRRPVKELVLVDARSNRQHGFLWTNATPQSWPAVPAQPQLTTELKDTRRVTAAQLVPHWGKPQSASKSGHRSAISAAKL